MKTGKIEEWIIPIEKVFLKYQKGTVKKDYDKVLFNGNPLKKEMFYEIISIQQRNFGYMMKVNSLSEYITGKKICFSQIRFFMTTTNERKPWNTFIIQNNFNFIIQW